LIFEDTDPLMPLAEMFEASILEFWDLSEDKPWLFVPGTQGRYDWCFAQAFKRSKDFTAILETVPGAEEAGTKRPAPSITPPPTSVIKCMRNCGRQMRLIGLANTSLDHSHALLIAGALRTLAALAPRWMAALLQSPAEGERNTRLHVCASGLFSHCTV
jgi:hypothetical protein